MATGDQANMLQRIKAVLPPWFGSLSPLLDGLLSGPAWMWAWSYAQIQYVRAQARITTATGVFLDMAATDFLGTRLKRSSGQGDAGFRSRLLAEVLQAHNTRAAMIARVYGLTGRTPTIIEPERPLDTGVYAPGGSVTFGGLLYSTARATTATWVDAAGVLRTADAGVARPLFAAGVQTGVLNEPAATNLLLRSNEMDGSAWSKVTITATPNTTAAPDGETTADTLTAGATGGCYTLQFFTVAAGGTYTFSAWLRAGTMSWVQIQISKADQSNGVRAWFNLASPSVGYTTALGTGTLISAKVEAAAGSWVRVSITGIIDSATTVGTVWIVPWVGNFTGGQLSGGTIYTAGMQFEAGSAATSYIPTTTATATRAADALVSTAIAAAGYGVAGSYGSLALPGQFFMVVPRSLSAGVPNVAGYGSSVGGYGVGSIEYVSADMAAGALTDADLMLAIDGCKPAGTNAWVRFTF